MFELKFIVELSERH